MFDIIGKRRWFYAFSLLITIPGLIFILLTPFTDAGLQFTIDYTGGTNWEIRFQDPNVTPDQVEAVFAEEGLAATAVTTGSGFIDIKTEPIGLVEAPAATPVPTLAPSASASAGASAVGVGRGIRVGGCVGSGVSRGLSGGFRLDSAVGVRRPERDRPSPSASASPAPSGSPSPSASPAAAAGNTQLPTAGKLGAVREALEAELGPIAAQNSLTTIGPVVSSDLIGQALILILVGSIGILLWITYRFRDVKFGVTALVALLHDVIVVVGVFAILGTFFGVEIDAPVRHRDADGHRLQRARHDRRVRPDPREQGAPCSASRSPTSSTTRSCRPSGGRSRRASPSC